jgi:PAS domain S-box-containing protein
MFTSQEFEALFENASIGIVVINDQGRIVLINNFLLQQFGYTHKELIGKEIELLIPKRFKAAHSNHRQHFLHQPQNRPMGIGLDLYATRKDRTEFPVEVSLAHYSSNGQKFAVAYITDISVRKTAENALKALNVELEKMVLDRTQSLTETVAELNKRIKEVEAKDFELHKANTYLKSIWKHAGAIIIATDRNGIIELFNPAAEQFLGYAATEIIGIHTPLLFHDPEEIRMQLAKSSKELSNPNVTDFGTIASAMQFLFDNKHEWTLISKNGSRLPIDLTITTLQNGSNAITGYLEIGIDVTNRKKAEAELRSALQKEKELGELKSRFVSIASHEFRTPLSTILSSAYLISQYQTGEEQYKRDRHIERIVSSVNLLNEILGDFLSVGKIEEGKTQVRKKECNIRQLAKEILTDMQGVRKKGQAISYQHVGSETLDSDPALLKHIVINLVSNAIKFSPEQASIDIMTEINDHSFVLTVRDKGIGIPEEDQEHLYDLFYRAGNVTNIQGTGLGLHIVKRYTELLGGAIHCKSKVGEGTEFKAIFNL